MLSCHSTGIAILLLHTLSTDPQVGAAAPHIQLAPCPPLFQVARAVMGIKNEWEDPNGTCHGQGHCSSPKSRIKGDKHKNSSYRMGSSNECHFAKTKQNKKPKLLISIIRISFLINDDIYDASQWVTPLLIGQRTCPAYSHSASLSFWKNS